VVRRAQDRQIVGPVYESLVTPGNVSNWAMFCWLVGRPFRTAAYGV